MRKLFASKTVMEQPLTPSDCCEKCAEPRIKYEVTLVLGDKYYYPEVNKYIIASSEEPSIIYISDNNEIKFNTADTWIIWAFIEKDGIVELKVKRVI